MVLLNNHRFNANEEAYINMHKILMIQTFIMGSAASLPASAAQARLRRRL
jgi:hypothetical protein